jgi:hypothetical protein
MRFILSILLPTIVMNVYAGTEMSLENNVDSLYQIKYDQIYWGGIRINTIQITKRQNHIILEAIVKFSSDDTDKKNRYKKYTVDDTIWNNFKQIIKNKDIFEPENRSKGPIKRDVSSRLMVYVKEKNEINSYRDKFNGNKVINYLKLIANEKTDIFNY